MREGGRELPARYFARHLSPFVTADASFRVCSVDSLAELHLIQLIFYLNIFKKVQFPKMCQICIIIAIITTTVPYM